MRTGFGRTLVRSTLVAVPVVLIVLWAFSNRSHDFAAPTIRDAATDVAPVQSLVDGTAPVLASAPGSPRASDVRQVLTVAARRSARLVTLQFRCETLGKHNTAPVWKFMELEVHVESANGAELAVCMAPWREATLYVPDGQDRISVRARGYQLRSVELSKCLCTKQGAPIVTLTPDASLLVIARHLPIGQQFRYSIGVGLPTQFDDVMRFRLVGQRVSAADARGQLRFGVEVPSGVSLLAVLGSANPWRGNSAKLASQIRELEPLTTGESRECVFDLDDLGRTRGRVIGLPPLAAGFQRVSIHVPGLRARRFSIPLADDGGFEIRGLSIQPIELRLEVHGKWPWLRRVGSKDTIVVPEDGQFLVLEPSFPVVGVVPVAQGTIVDLPFAVGAVRQAEAGLDSKIPLFTSEWLERSVVHFRVRHIGSFTRSLKGWHPGPDGLIRVEVPVPGGEVIVQSEQALTEKWRFALVQTISDGRSNWIDPDDSSNDRRVFRGIPAGEYRLLLGYRGKHDVNLTHNTEVRKVTVRSREKTQVSVRLPIVVEATAEVRRREPWVEAFGAVRLCLWSNGRGTFLDVPSGGKFSILVFEDWQGLERATLQNKRLFPALELRDHHWDPGRRHLEIRCPPRGGQTYAIEARSIADGGLWLHVYPKSSNSRHPGVDVMPRQAGLFELQRTEEALDIMLMENAFDRDGNTLKVVRGWLRIPAGERRRRSFASTGRWVRIRRDTPGVSRVRVLAPNWWHHPAYQWATRRIEGTESQRVWLAASARGLGIDGREIAAGDIEEELVIR